MLCRKGRGNQQHRKKGGRVTNKTARKKNHDIMDDSTHDLFLVLRGKTTVNLTRSPWIYDAELLLQLPLVSPPLVKISRALLNSVFFLLFLCLSSHSSASLSTYHGGRSGKTLTRRDGEKPALSPFASLSFSALVSLGDHLTSGLIPVCPNCSLNSLSKADRE